MTRAAPLLAMLAATIAATAAHAQAPLPDPLPATSDGPQVLTFAITVLPPPPVLAPPVAAPPAAAGPVPPGSWVVSETRSPVDYAPVASATQVAADDDGPRLSIQCRGGQALVLVMLPTAASGGESVSVGIDDEPPRPLRGAPSPTQNAVVLREPAQRFLAGLPDSGSLRLRLAAPGQPVAETRVPLAGVARVRQRLAQPCGWPAK